MIKKKTKKVKKTAEEALAIVAIVVVKVKVIQKALKVIILNFLLNLNNQLIPKYLNYLKNLKTITNHISKKDLEI